MLSQNKIDFIKFMLSCNVLQFGNFITKSGRQTPYFINTGNYKTGRQIKILGSFLAKKIVDLKLNFDLIFGPAYKGIPLAVSCCNALFNDFEIDVPFCFDRKEEKDHGEKGLLVGCSPKPNDKILILEDVLTAGTEINKIVPKLKEKFDVKFENLILTVDRCEKIKDGEESAKNQIKKNFGIKTNAIVNIFEIRNFIASSGDEFYLKYLEPMDSYLKINCLLN